MVFRLAVVALICAGAARLIPETAKGSAYDGAADAGVALAFTEFVLAPHGYHAVLRVAEQGGEDAAFDLRGLAIVGRNGAVCPTADAGPARRLTANGVSHTAIFFPARDCFESFPPGSATQLIGRLRVTRRGRAQEALFRLPN